jgi:DNA-binding GntR family transcriptional regulator
MMDDGPVLKAELGRRRTATDLAFARLRQAIINGEFMPDERLTEIKLANTLRISRTPLRQALQQLETEGWIRRTSTGGIRVGGVSELEIESLYDVRSSLECLALSEAIARMRESDVSGLRSILAGQKRALNAGDYLAAADLSESFHRKLWQLSSNDVCIEFLETINGRTKRYRRIAFGGQANIGQGVAEHEQIMDRIVSKDTEGAQALLVTHIEHSRSAVKSAFLNWERGAG